MRRRLFWLMVLTAAVAVAAAYRVRERAHRIRRQDPWPTLDPVGGGVAGAMRPPSAPPAEEVPTEAPAKVVATMEAPAATGSQYEDNGSTSVDGEAVASSSTQRAGASQAPAAFGAPVGAAPQVAPVESSRRRRLSSATLAALGMIAGLGAIALGAWGIASSVSDNGGSTAPPAVANVSQVVSLISKPTTATIPLQGSGRRIILVVGARGYGVLVLNNVQAPPAGKTYEAWVIKPTVKAPQPAGLFSGGTKVVKLTTPVPPGAVVAITVEPAGGSPAPTQKPKLLATRT